MHYSAYPVVASLNILYAISVVLFLYGILVGPDTGCVILINC
jgi:hypothetical protein